MTEDEQAQGLINLARVTQLALDNNDKELQNRTLSVGKISLHVENSLFVSLVKCVASEIVPTAVYAHASLHSTLQVGCFDFTTCCNLR